MRADFAERALSLLTVVRPPLALRCCAAAGSYRPAKMRISTLSCALVCSMAAGASAALAPTSLRPGQGPVFRFDVPRKPTLLRGLIQHTVARMSILFRLLVERWICFSHSFTRASSLPQIRKGQVERRCGCEEEASGESTILPSARLTATGCLFARIREVVINTQYMGIVK